MDILGWPRTDLGRFPSEAGWQVVGGSSGQVLGGSPDGIKGSAARWLAFAVQAEIAGAAVDAVAAMATAEFLGDEGIGYAERLRVDLATGLRTVSDAWQRVGEALTRYAGELQDCQDELRRLTADGGPPGSSAAHEESAGATVRQRCEEVRRRHEQAQRVCCRSIDAARELAPPRRPDIAGITRRPAVAGGRGVGRFTVLASISAGLRVAAGTSTQLPVPAPVQPSVRVDEGDSAPVTPLPKDQYDRLYQACRLEHGSSLIDNWDLDVDVDCRSVADSANVDLDARKAAFDRYPMVEHPAGPLPGGWDGFTDALQVTGDLVASILGVPGCADGDAGACTGEVAMAIFPGGLLVKAAKRVVETARAGARAIRRGSQAAEDVPPVKVGRDRDSDPGSERTAGNQTRSDSEPGPGPSGKEIGKRTNQLGADREVRVAELTGGTIPSGAPGKPGMKIVQPRVGKTDVDVIGSDGAYIAVGGPGKGANQNAIATTIKKLNILKYCADEAGRPAAAYFEEGTSPDLLQRAEQVLGPGNVHVFEMPTG